MKKFILFATVISMSCYAQKKPLETFYQDAKIELKESRIVMVDILSQEGDFIKAKLKVTNTSEFPLLIKPKDCTYTNNNGATFFSKNKDWFLVYPGETDTKVITANGMGEKINTDSVSFNLNSYYECKSTKKVTNSEKILEHNKTVTLDNFTYTILDIDNNDGYKNIKCKIQYTGDNVGVVIPAKLVLKSKDGSETINQKGKNGDLNDLKYSFHKGEDRTFTFHFESNTKKQNTLVWTDALNELIPTEIQEKHTTKLFVDQNRTLQANKSIVTQIKETVKEIKGK